MKQEVVDIGLFIWAFAHDGIFLLAWIAWEKTLGRKRLDKAIKKSVEERLSELEALHKKELAENERAATPQTVSATGSTSD